MPIRNELDSVSDRVVVEVRGVDLAALKEQAKTQAARFFGVDAATATLTLDGLQARPVVTDIHGAVTLYVARVTVEYATSAVTGPGEWSGAATVPARRPAGPSLVGDDEDDVLPDEEDDDDDDDDDSVI